MLARSIERHPDYRVLRRPPRHEKLWFSPIANDGGGTTIAIIDAETTGLDPDRDAMIELAVVLMQIDGAGDLLDLTLPVAMLEEPPRAIPSEVEALNGITDAIVSSRAADKLFWKVDQRYWHRHTAKPDLTGLAQVRGFRGATLLEEDLSNRLQADLEYLENWTIWRDIKIIVLTFRVLLHRNAF